MSIRCLVFIIFSLILARCSTLGNAIVNEKQGSLEHAIFFTDSEKERQKYLEQTGKSELIEWFGQFADDYEPSIFEEIWMAYNDAIFFPFWIPQILIYGDTPRRSYDADAGFFQRVKEKAEPLGKKILRAPSRLSHYTNALYDATALLIPNLFYYGIYDQTIFGTIRTLKRKNFQGWDMDAIEIQEEFSPEEFQDHLQNLGFDPEDFDESDAEKMGLDEEDYQLLRSKGYFSIQENQTTVGEKTK